MTKKLAVTLALLAGLPTLASAGELYGKITSGGAAAAEGTEVSAKCGAKPIPPSRPTRRKLPPRRCRDGKCTLTVTQKGQSASLDVVSYDEGAQATSCWKRKTAS
jgi:hypothetical protein